MRSADWESTPASVCMRSSSRSPSNFWRRTQTMPGRIARPFRIVRSVRLQADLGVVRLKPDAEYYGVVEKRGSVCDDGAVASRGGCGSRCRAHRAALLEPH